MTAPWMPPLPRAAIDEHNLQGGRLLYTADQMRQAQADAARAALEQAAQIARDSADQDGDVRCIALAVHAADAIRELAKEIT